MVSRMVVGKRFGGATTKDENEGNDNCRKVLRDFFHLSGTFVVSDALPYLRWLDVGGYEKAMKKTAKELDHMVGGGLEEPKQRKLCGGKENQDCMDVLLSIVTDEDEISSYDADTIVKATCLVRAFFFFFFFYLFLITILIHAYNKHYLKTCEISNRVYYTLISVHCLYIYAFHY